MEGQLQRDKDVRNLEYALAKASTYKLFKKIQNNL